MTEETADKLRQIELFSRLETGDLRRLAALFERAEYRQDDCLTQHGETSTCLHLLESGRATAWRMDSGGVEEPVRDLGPGDSFGVAALFLNDASNVTVQITENATVLSLERSRLDQYLDDFPQVRDGLLLPAAIEERLSTPQFDWLTADEYVVFFSTKSRWALVAAEVTPLLIFLVVTAVASLTRHILYLPVILTASAVLVGGGLALIKWLDWRNDYYVVTNKRVVHYESRLPTLQVTVKQAPLHQVQNVNMLKSGPIARSFNFGTLDIQTAGVEGSIAFRYLDDPEQCQQLIFDLLEETRSLEKAIERVSIYPPGDGAASRTPGATRGGNGSRNRTPYPIHLWRGSVGHRIALHRAERATRATIHSGGNRPAHRLFPAPLSRGEGPGRHLAQASVCARQGDLDTSSHPRRSPPGGSRMGSNRRPVLQFRGSGALFHLVPEPVLAAMEIRRLAKRCIPDDRLTHH